MGTGPSSGGARAEGVHVDYAHWQMRRYRIANAIFVAADIDLQTFARPWRIQMRRPERRKTAEGIGAI